MPTGRNARLVWAAGGIGAAALALLALAQLRSAPPPPVRDEVPAAAEAGESPAATELPARHRATREERAARREARKTTAAPRPAPQLRPIPDPFAERTRPAMTPQELERVRERVEAAESARRALRAAPNRESRALTPEERAALREIEASLRQDLGEEDYAEKLYAAGKYNRAQVRKVMRYSPSGDAGLQPGDVVIRYDGREIFSPEDLHRLAREAEPGTSVSIVFKRGDQYFEGSMKTGPPGMLMDHRRIKP